ncbi:MAG: CDP-alcohol phosphatidyltransferase family protein [Actinobacteria bacterium]|nr:CDP-alcohol phosphatidyltransferase family protein [Actinomycetota bacterium]
MASLKSRYTDGARALFFRVGAVLARRGFTADLMTILGLVLQAAAVPLIITGHFIWALVIGVVASLCDALDGAVARAGVGPTRAGAFLDSTLDRVSELLVGGALVVYFVREGADWGPVVAVLVFMGAAQLVSYTRARAEALGVDCRVGFMSRPERLVGLGLGFLFAWWEPGGTSFLVWMLYVLAAATSATVVHRALHVLRKLRLEDREPALPEPPPPGDERYGDDTLGDDLWPATSGRGSPRS